VTGLVASALNAPNVVVDWTEDNLLRHIRLDPACDPKGLERILVSRRAVASGTAGEVFAGASISVPASMSLAAWSMSLAALIAVKSEAAPHPAWGSDARPIRRLPVCVWNPWDAGNCKQQQTNKRTFAFDV